MNIVVLLGQDFIVPSYDYLRQKLTLAYRVQDPADAAETYNNMYYYYETIPAFYKTLAASSLPVITYGVDGFAARSRINPKQVIIEPYGNIYKKSTLFPENIDPWPEIKSLIPTGDTKKILVLGGNVPDPKVMAFFLNNEYMVEDISDSPEELFSNVVKTALGSVNL